MSHKCETDVTRISPGSDIIQRVRRREFWFFISKIAIIIIIIVVVVIKLTAITHVSTTFWLITRVYSRRQGTTRTPTQTSTQKLLYFRVFIFVRLEHVRNKRVVGSTRDISVRWSSWVIRYHSIRWRRVTVWYAHGQRMFDTYSKYSWIFEKTKPSFLEAAGRCYDTRLDDTTLYKTVALLRDTLYII